MNTDRRSHGALGRALSPLRSCVLGFGALALAGALSSDADAQSGYCATLGGLLYEVEPATGVLLPVLSTGVNNLFGIANAGPPGELILSGVTAGLFRADLATGTVTSLPAAGAPMFALCNNEDDGAIYGVSLANLYEIDPVTGATSLIGPTGAINIYGLDYHQGLQTLIGFDPITNQIWSIDPTTGAGSPIGPAMPGIIGLWYDASSDTLYGVCDQNNNGCISEIDPTTGATTQLFSTGLNLVSIGGDLGGGAPSSIGTNYCTAAPNSTGAPSTISAIGTTLVADNDVTLRCEGLPLNQFGIFLVSSVQDFVPGTGGTSNGNLCLGGTIGRYSQPGQILFTGTAGEFELAIDLTQIPAGGVTQSVSPGDTWNFQAWHREFGGLASNFSDGLEITFQ